MTDEHCLARGVRVCSTPFGITEVGMLSVGRMPCQTRSMCSTPFGITEVGIRRAQVAARRPWCSTPFGITEVGMSATASSLLHGATMCSTPFGITEVGIAGRPRSRAELALCSTPFGITEVGMLTTAIGCERTLMVLNAFRHHRGGHQGTCPRGAIRSRVLNAFRHHRGGHGAVRLISRRLTCACSTPFGITEVGIAPFQTPSMKHLAQAVFKVGVGSQPKTDERGLAPLRPTAQFFQGTGVRENHGSSELPRSLKFNPRNLLSGFLGLGPPHSWGCLNCAKRRDWDLGRRHLPCSTVRRCHTAPGRRASSGRSGPSGSFPCLRRSGRRVE